jgi:hypothetical protein
MERLVRDALMKYFDQNNLLSDNQYGFIPGRSCTLQLLVCIERWSKDIEDGLPVDVVYTDLGKAFDTVSHRKLGHKLSSIGVKGNILEWIMEFLAGRRQKVRIEDSYSDWENVKSGVPQGSVLGPILFLVYINDLPKVLTKELLMLFADDAKLEKTLAAPEDHIILQDNLNKMTDWTKAWSLEMNTSKCKVLHLSRMQQENVNNYTMNCETGPVVLQDVPYEKDLGVYVDQKLTFEKHISNSSTTANRILGVVRRNFRHINQENFVTLYKSMVRPHMEYSSVVWSPHLAKDQKLLENVQRRATKLSFKNKSLDYEGRLRNLGLPTLQYRRSRADMIQVFKIMRGLDRINPSVFFTASHNERTRGHKYKIFKNRCRTNFRKFQFSNRVVDSWNSLPDHVVNSPNINTFKSRLNTHWKHYPTKFSPSFIL